MAKTSNNHAVERKSWGEGGGLVKCEVPDPSALENCQCLVSLILVVDLQKKITGYGVFTFSRGKRLGPSSRLPVLSS